jgi:chromosome segregation ATPase
MSIIEQMQEIDQKRKQLKRYNADVHYNITRVEDLSKMLAQAEESLLYYAERIPKIKAEIDALTKDTEAKEKYIQNYSDKMENIEEATKLALKIKALEKEKSELRKKLEEQQKPSNIG